MPSWTDFKQTRPPGARSFTDVTGISGDAIAFQATLADGSQGMYIWSLPVLAGDFNRNGIVDAADYTVWRDGLGKTYSQADYGVWKSNFGNHAGSGSGVGAAVPEPATLALLLLATAVVAVRDAGRRVKTR